MPTGIYKRTEKHRQQMQKAFAKGRNDPVARQKAIESLRRNGASLEFKEKMRKIITEEDQERRNKRIAGAKRFLKQHGPNFRGGNGQTPTEKVLFAEAILKPLGFLREFAVSTKGHSTGHKPPDNYKIDFANPINKIGIELDGPSHRKLERKEQDKRKTEVLNTLGWIIHRIQHR